MARPERQIVSDDVALVEFVQGLRALRGSAGLTLQELSHRAHYSISALSDATNGKRVPTWELTESFVRACGGDVTQWRFKWVMANKRLVPIVGQPEDVDPPAYVSKQTNPPRASLLKIAVVAVVAALIAVQTAVIASLFMTANTAGMKLVGNPIPSTTTGTGSRWYTYGVFQASVGAVLGVGLGWGAALFFKRRARNAPPEPATHPEVTERTSSSTTSMSSTGVTGGTLSLS